MWSLALNTSTLSLLSSVVFVVSCLLWLVGVFVWLSAGRCVVSKLLKGKFGEIGTSDCGPKSNSPIWVYHIDPKAE